VRFAVHFALVAIAVAASEWAGALLGIEWLQAAVMAGALVSGGVLAWNAPKHSGVRGPLDAAALAGISYAVLFGANLPFLKWLWRSRETIVDPHFSWVEPYYVVVLWIGGASLTALASAVVAGRRG
jgi:hypothetical protein